MCINEKKSLDWHNNLSATDTNLELVQCCVHSAQTAPLSLDSRAGDYFTGLQTGLQPSMEDLMHVLAPRGLIDRWEVEGDLRVIEGRVTFWEKGRVCDLGVCIALGLLENVQCGLQSSINNAVCSVQLDTILLHGVDDLGDDIASPVIEDRMGSEPLDEVMVLGTGGGVDSEAECLGRLNGQRPYTARCAPDQDRLFVRGSILGVERNADCGPGS